MCEWRDRNRAPGASLTFPNEGHNPCRAFRRRVLLSPSPYPSLYLSPSSLIFFLSSPLSFLSSLLSLSPSLPSFASPTGEARHSGQTGLASLNKH